MSTLIRGGQVIAFQQGEHRLLPAGDVLISGPQIEFVGRSYSGPADSVVDASKHIVMPGFISIHTHPHHSPLTRSYLEDSGSKLLGQSSLYEYLPLSFVLPEEVSKASFRFSYVEMLSGGVTTVVDLASFAPTLSAQIAREVGVRVYVGPRIADGFSSTDDGRSVQYRWDEAKGKSELASAVEFSLEQLEGPDGLVQPLMAPRAVDHCSPALLKEVRQAARDLGLRVQIHTGQSTVEFHEMLRRHGQTSIEYLAENDMLGPDVILGHCVYISGHPWLQFSGNDLEMIASSGAHVAHCPWVFARRGMGLHTLDRYWKAGINVGIGLDTFPQDMFNELRTAAIICKQREQNMSVATAREIFDAATIGSAAALGRADLGRIAPGAKADIVLLRLDTLRMSPYRDPLRNIVWSGTPSDVDTVFVDGKVVVENGVALGYDERELAEQIQAAAAMMWQGFPQKDWAGRSVDELAPLSLPMWEDHSVGEAV